MEEETKAIRAQLAAADAKVVGKFFKTILNLITLFSRSSPDDLFLLVVALTEQLEAL